MKQIQVYRIDKDGYFIEPILIDGNFLPTDQFPKDLVLIKPTDGLFKAKWNSGQWEEGLSQQEIDEIKNPPRAPSEPEIIGQQIVEKELQILQLLNENKALSQSIADLERRLTQGGL